MPRAVLVTDFDGTLTRGDFYHVARTHLLPADAPDYYLEFTAGGLTHFDCLARTYAGIPHPEAEVLTRVREMGVEPRLPELLPRLAAAGWEVVVASAGCAWYIDRLLAGAAVTVHANRGRFAPGAGLVMERPAGSPFFCPDVGVSKPAVVRDALARAEVVAYAGDGLTDVPALLLVRPELRFARGDAAAALAADGAAFRGFSEWAEIAEAVLAEGW